MRKLLILITTICLAVSFLTATASAAEPYELLPVDIIYSYDRMEIRKVYEMAASVDPSTLPRTEFERDGIKYKCIDVLREVVIGDETKTYVESETVESAKNDITTVLTLFQSSKEVFTEDGFFGVIYLSTSSIKSEVSGYGSSKSTVSITRSYPNLSDADSQYIPKTITDGGITYTLTDIQWQADNHYNIDDWEIGNRFTANATYSGQKTSSYVKGYKVTADYIGEICRTGVSMIRYTVVFTGAKVENTAPPKPTQTTETDPSMQTEPDPSTDPELNSNKNTENESGSNWLFLVIPLALLAAASTAGVIYLYLNKAKESKHHEEIPDYDYADVDSDSSDSESDDGSRL